MVLKPARERATNNTYFVSPDTWERRAHRGWYAAMKRSLGRAILIISLACAAPFVFAGPQLEIPGPFHLSHLAGIVVGQNGMPVERAEVNLVQDEKIVYSTRTDAKGHFQFKGVTGHYVLRMHVPGYSIVSREVIVGFEIVTALEGNKLYVILGPGACSDDCSSVFTSKREFNQALRRMAGHKR
jgi:hypothetical protein